MLLGLLLALGCQHRGSDARSLRAGAAPSCKGLEKTCGPKGDGDCCTSLPVPGGTFNRGYDGILYKEASHPATISDFYLDEYEISVGRFRAFVNAGLGTQQSPPAQ